MLIYVITSLTRCGAGDVGQPQEFVVAEKPSSGVVAVEKLQFMYAKDVGQPQELEVAEKPSSGVVGVDKFTPVQRMLVNLKN